MEIGLIVEIHFLVFAPGSEDNVDFSTKIIFLAGLRDPQELQHRFHNNYLNQDD